MNIALFIYRVVLFVVATFAFVVLFDHGPQNFGDHLANDARALVQWVTAR